MKYLVFFTMSLISGSSLAQNLKPKALLTKCYQQLTQSVLKVNDPLLAMVDAGQDPIEVCIEHVFRKGFLTAGSIDSGKTLDNAQKTSIGVKVATFFHQLHSSWFMYRGNHGPINNSNLSNGQMNAVYEPNGAANYFTRTLLDPSVNTDYFMRASDYLRSVRSSGPTTLSDYAGATRSAEYANFLGSNIMYERGHLWGFRALASSEMTFNAPNRDIYNRGATGIANGAGPLSIFQHFGGGFMGLDIYVARTFDELNTVQGDGVTEVARKWSEAVYHDLLCRELPVVRQSDAAPYVVPNSDAEFRKATSCTTCHVSIDPMAGLYKSVSYFEDRIQKVWGLWVDKSLWNKGAGANYNWSSEDRTTFRRSGNDFSNYKKEDHVGTIFYRGYDGRLININVDSPTSLGAGFASQIEPYMCLTKRYYEYFTGVSVSLEDPGPSPAPIHPNDLPHFQFVIDTAKSLANTASNSVSTPKPMHTVIEAILRSPQYKKLKSGVADE